MTRWPVTGRTDELRQLTTALAEQRGAVITGPAGVGKTTLAMACLQSAEDRGISVAHTTATHASRELPLGAVASFLPPDPGGGAHGPGELSALLSRFGQRPCGLDVALKASAGHANKQIAADLHHSVRTVENRLQRLYEKLGVSGRHRLGDALRDLPTT